MGRREARQLQGDASVGGASETLLTIGQMARLNGISEKALRVYQAKGILEPAQTNPETGYRSYTLGQCATLDMIRQLGTVGFSLDQIADVLATGDVFYLRDRVREHVSAIEKQMRQLAMAHQIGGDLLRSCEVYLHKPPLEQLVLETVPERRILEFPLEEPTPNRPDASGPSALGAWEVNLRRVRQRIVDQGLPVSLFRTVGCVIAHEDLLAGRILYSSAFVFVTPAFGSAIYESATLIPAGTHLIEYIDNVFTEDGRERETVEIERMLRFCDEHGLEPAGDYRGEVIADGPAFLYEGRGMLFKMCLPVRLKGQPSWEMPRQHDVMSVWRDGDGAGGPEAVGR